MSTTVDSRVVEMRFDNKQFEQNVATSLSTLSKLKQSLNLDGATKGLESINAATKNCNMSGLSNAVQTVEARFSALGVMGVTALANITNSVINTGKQMLASLTIEPITQGFSEYELKMNSVQTIMASTGATLEEVNGYLDELNEYADKTIYSFSDMTTNIGKFTNAGVKLEDAVMAIQGISNEAAVSGANANEASRAMYNFAQALSAGYVKLIDWKSIESANMATVEFKNQLLESAVAAGTLEKTADGMYKVLTTNGSGSSMSETISATHNFNESLEYQWMTTDALVGCLKNYADETTEIGKKAFAAAQDVKTFTQLMDTLKEAAGSGWAQTWEILFGDFEEAKVLWTDVNNVLGKLIDTMSDSRNSLLQGWKDLGGRTALIEALTNAFDGLVSVVKPIGEAFREIFPATTAEQLYAMTVALKEFTSHLTLSDEASVNLKSTFKGLFAILDILKQAFVAVLEGISPLFGGLDDLGGGILSVTGKIGEWLVALDEFIKKNNVFETAVEAVTEFITKLVDKFKEFISAVREKFDFPGVELFHATLERIHERLSQVGEAVGNVKSGFVSAIESMSGSLANAKFLEFFETLFTSIQKLGTGIASALGTMVNSLLEGLSNANFSEIFDLLNGIALSGIGAAIWKFVNNIKEVSEVADSIREGIIGILGSVKDCFKEYQKEIKAKTLLKIAEAIAILAASLVVISLIDSDKLAGSLAAIGVLFGELIASMAIYDKLGGAVGKGSAKMIIFASAILILSNAVTKMADLDWNGLAKGLVGVGVLLAEIDVFMATAKFSKGAATTATGILLLANAIKVLASAAVTLAALSWNELAKGLTGVGVLLAEVDVFLNTAKLSAKAITTAIGVVILAAGLKVLASACGDFGDMNWGEIAKGLTSIGALLGEVAVFTNLTGNAKHVVASGAALVEIAAAMKIFASAMEDFGKFSWEQIAKGLVSMGGALAEVAVATNLMPNNMVSIGTGLVVVAAAFEVMADVLTKMGGFSWEQIAKGLTTIGIALAELAVGLNVMKGTLSGSAALLVAASALAVLTPVLSVLGAMSWEAIAKGLISIAGAFTVLGVAGAVLSPIIPAILGVSAAMALMGVGILALGGGLMAAGTGLLSLAAGFTALAAAGAAGATSIVSSLTVIILGIANLIPAIAQKIAEGIVTFCKAIAQGASAIGEAVKSIVLTVIDVLTECVPTIVDGILVLLTTVLTSLVTYTPQIVGLIFDFLIQVLEKVAEKMPQLVQAVMDVLDSFFSSVIEALKGLDTETIVQGITAVGLLSALMVALSAITAFIPGAMAGVLGMGVVIAELALVLAAIGALAQIPGLSWLIGEGGDLLQGIGTAIGQFIGGIVGGFATGVSSQFPQIGADLSAFMTNIQPFLEGASAIQPSMMDGVNALAETILILTAADILQSLTSWLTGGASLSGFAEDLVPFGKAMKEFSTEIAGMDGEVVANAATAGKTLAEMASTLPNTGGVISFFTGNNDMKAFGEQLVPFGEAMMSFAGAVEGLDANAVTEASIAGKAMAEMATTIPNTGGVVGFFAGNNDMDTFGEQLVPFGEAMYDFAQAVDGLKADAVVNSATAGKALIELADTVPNSGGVVGFFAGENDMNLFGAQIVPFGKAMKEYSDAVSGIDAEAVTNSATAGKALVELANTLPNTGGVVSWFTGDNDIGTFGESLIVFGENFAQYSNYMTGVDAGIVTATTNAATSIVELRKSLPEDGGWFSSDMDLATFGKDLASFGAYFSSYYAYVSDVDTGILSSVINQTSRLVDLANGMAELDTSGMSGFGSALTDLGKAGIDGFISAFDNANSRITAAATTMVTSFSNAAKAQQSNMNTAFSNIVTGCLTTIRNKQSEFQNVGSTLMVKVITGLQSQTSNAKSATMTIVSGCLTTIKNKYSDFNSVGSQTISRFISGMKSQNSNVKSAIGNIVTLCLTTIRNKQSEFQNVGKLLVSQMANAINSQRYLVQNASSQMATSGASSARNAYNDFYNAGYYLVSGFAYGISNNTYMAEARARAMAAAAAAAAKRELNEHSPSKVGYEIGDYFGVAFVNAIVDYKDKAYDASSEMAQSAKTGLTEAVSKISDVIDSDIDTEPTIRPVLDLSNVTDGASTIGRLLNSDYSMNLASKAGSASFQNGVGGSTTTTTNNDEVVSAISSLRNDFSSLATAISNLKIVMDTGTLVGTLSAPLNRALGKQAAYEERGI